jgi:lipopolysaccharide transport system ATP-binding protein
MKAIIDIEKVWKSYKIGRQQQRYLSLRDSIAGFFRNGLAARKQAFWALKEVGFKVYEGESVGIIGHNGAGKSTLLKILSRITPPSKGRITLRGRVASLLEVGTGFHPELTGRENVYLNGAILGLKKAEINRKFDEIVDFSGVEQFLDTPLKHYSSGMQLRLAFSVAAFLEPEILLIDEVLAVGDADFQKKCLGKMGEVSQSGRTIIFVSHNLGAVRQLCSRAILLKGGKVEADTDVENVIANYRASNNSTEEIYVGKREGSQFVFIKKIELENADGKPYLSNTFYSGDDVIFRVFYESSPHVKDVKLRDFHLGLAVYNISGQFVTVLNNKMSGFNMENMPLSGAVQCRLKRNHFISGEYYILSTLVVNGIVSDRVERIFTFKVEEADFYGSGFSNAFGRSGIYVEQQWTRI